MNDITLADAATMCRNLGHAWDPIIGHLKDVFRPGDWLRVKVKAGKRGWEAVVQCPRCTTKRYSLFNYENELVTRKYVYPKGYHDTRIPRPELKARLKTVLKVWGSEQEMEMWQ